MIDFITGLISFLIISVAILVSPHRASCPPHWHVEGVRPSGSYECRPNPVQTIPDHQTNHGAWIDTSTQPDGHLFGIVYCETQPIVISDQVVGCLPR